MIAQLPDWGCDVTVIGGALHSRPCTADGKVYSDCDFAPVDLVCEHFLRDVNAALGTAFAPSDFPIDSCEGHDEVTR